MAKVFNVAALCIPEKHYMVNLDSRLTEIRKLIDGGQYFTINRARQYGKTTILTALEQYLQDDYHIAFLDFQTFGAEEFANENSFSLAFANSFLRALKRHGSALAAALESLDRIAKTAPISFRLQGLFAELSDVCAAADKPVILLIDEVDSAADNQVFLDFLAQLRAYYIRREVQPAFHSVVLAGVYDVRNLKRKIRSEDTHRMNSPWNIAADFNVDMSFSVNDIAGMLQSYEADRHTGMDINKMAELLHDYTSGYPFLVSRLCKILDENICNDGSCWTAHALNEALRQLLSEKNPLFDSLIEKLTRYPELNSMLKSLLFTGRSITYNADESTIDIATMFGFIKKQDGAAVIANRIFETRLYNYYLSDTELQNLNIYKASLKNQEQFITDGRLNMRKILERFVICFDDLYRNSKQTFIEEEGRKYFLLFLRPIINGTGNYYIESRTRSLGRTDIIVDYHGEQFVIEMKIWHGDSYNTRGKKQLVQYLDDYHIKTGYLLSFNFNQKKETGVHEIEFDGKLIIEAVV